jgi:hypothetical protein
MLDIGPWHLINSAESHLRGGCVVRLEHGLAIGGVPHSPLQPLSEGIQPFLGIVLVDFAGGPRHGIDWSRPRRLSGSVAQTQDDRWSERNRPGSADLAPGLSKRLKSVGLEIDETIHLDPEPGDRLDQRIILERFRGHPDPPVLFLVTPIEGAVRAAHFKLRTCFGVRGKSSKRLSIEPGRAESR